MNGGHCDGHSNDPNKGNDNGNGGAPCGGGSQVTVVAKITVRIIHLPTRFLASLSCNSLTLMIQSPLPQDSSESLAIPSLGLGPFRAGQDLKINGRLSGQT